MSGSAQVDPSSEGFAAAILAQIPSLRSYAAGLAASAADADDLVQDALVRIWRYRDAFQPNYSLRGWMFRILRNEFLSQRRRRQPWIAEVEGRSSSQLTCAPAQEWGLRYGELLTALRWLPGEQRQALLLVAIGASYVEAARACGCDVGTLKSRVHRARARLATLLGVEAPRQAVAPPGARRREDDPPEVLG